MTVLAEIKLPSLKDKNTAKEMEVRKAEEKKQGEKVEIKRKYNKRK